MEGLFMTDNLTDKPGYKMTPQEGKNFLKNYGLTAWLDKLVEEYNTHNLDNQARDILHIKILSTEAFIDRQMEILDEEKTLKSEAKKLQDRELFIKAQAGTVLKKGEMFKAGNFDIRDEEKAVLAGHENLRRECMALEEKFKALDGEWEELYSEDVDFLVS